MYIDNWKACIRQKRIRGSNPRLSALIPLILLTFRTFNRIEGLVSLCAKKVHLGAKSAQIQRKQKKWHR